MPFNLSISLISQLRRRHSEVPAHIASKERKLQNYGYKERTLERGISVRYIFIIIVLILESPETEAQERAAQATEGAARAISEMTDNGNREEQKSTAAERAKAAQSGVDVVKSLL